MNNMAFSRTWVTKPLIEVATLQRGYDLPVQDRTHGPHPIFAANGTVGFHGIAKCKGPGVITGRSGTIGKVHYVENDYWPLNTSLYVKDFHGNDPKWVFYMLQTFGLERFSQGAGVPTLNRNLVHGEPIRVPPLPEQRRIAAILDKADALRAKRRETLVQLESLAKSVFVEMFGDPVSNPKGWPTYSLGDISEFENGDRSSNYPSGDDIKSDGVLFLSTKNIKKNRIDLSTTAFISESKFKSLSRGKARRDDILITLRGTLGSCCIFRCAHEEAFINAQMMIIRSGDLILSDYLLAVLGSKQFQDMFERIGQGAAVPQLTSKQLAELKVAVPPKSLQHEFLKRIQAIGLMELHYQASVTSADKLFESLQHRAFRGKI